MFLYRGIWYAGSYGRENINRHKCHYKAADAILMAVGYTDIGKKKKAREGLLKWQGGYKVNIQYTRYSVTAWTDSGKAYTAATEEEAREMLEEDSGKE